VASPLVADDEKSRVLRKIDVGLKYQDHGDPGVVGTTDVV
jgi:hypothetical protein